MRTFHIPGYLFGALLLSILLTSTLRAQAPRIISYQGVLTDASGQIKPDGSYQLRLRLYDSATGGVAVWRDDNLTVQVVRGIFSTTIGGEGKQPLPAFDRPYWLGIEVDAGGELKPRIQLTTVPYSIHAERADTAANVIGGIPVGTVMAFAGSAAKVPAGWMLCDGRTLSSGQLPALFDAIGTAWGDGTEDQDSATDFNLPDLRGMFLRGVDTSGSVDPDASTRYARKSGGAVGAQAGSYQDDASTGITANDPFTFNQSSSFDSQLGPDAGSGGSQTFTSRSGVESRPKNASVNYIIKVR
jgi:microcystin-dependent protein